MGPTFVTRAAEDTGATPAQIARAYAIARDSHGLRTQWAAIEALDNRIPAAAQYAMYHETSRLLRHATHWLLRHRRRSLEVDRTVSEFAPAIGQLAAGIGSALRGADLERHEAALAAHRKAQVPEPLARFMAATEALDAACDIAEIAARHRANVTEAATVYFEAGARTGLDWLRERIDRLAVDGTWQAVARGGLRDAAQRCQRRIAERVLAKRSRGTAAARVETWLRGAGEELAQWQRTLADMRAGGGTDFATLSVGVDAVRKLID
jgi:glutamate dehydrogenase